MMKKNHILSAERAKMKIRRMAYEILERNNGIKKLALAGIMDNGLHLAQMLKLILQEITTIDIIVIPLKVDKTSPQAPLVESNAISGYDHVIVVDDVVNSGKTLIYALLPFLSLEISRIQTLTLVERSYKIFPVHVDYVGISLATTFQDHIQVEFSDGQITGAFLH
jgi:pyrimidine operon attenuation protein/uracil phosphoribosyltransferase